LSTERLEAESSSLIVQGRNVIVTEVVERTAAERPGHDTIESILDWLIGDARRSASHASRRGSKHDPERRASLGHWPVTFPMTPTIASNTELMRIATIVSSCIVLQLR
jgi:hypothetical protein